jgi:hypothetical protein
MRLHLFITVLSSIFFLRGAFGKESAMNQPELNHEIESLLAAESPTDQDAIVTVVPQRKKASPVVGEFMKNIYS